MDLLARKEALSHQIEMMEEGIAYTGLHDLCFASLAVLKTPPWENWSL